jgi:hypothetical protein
MVTQKPVIEKLVIERGQIYWCGLDPVHGHEQVLTRPVVIVAADSYYRTLSPLTDTGLDSDSTALTRLRGTAIGKVGPEAMGLVDPQLGRVLGL